MRRFVSWRSRPLSCGSPGTWSTTPSWGPERVSSPSGWELLWGGSRSSGLSRCPGDRRARKAPPSSPRAGIVRILSILAALVVVAGLMNLLGFQLTMFLFMVFLLMVLGRQTLWMTLIIALVCSVGVYHLFGRYLDVQLPAASLAFLANLGL